MKKMYKELLVMKAELAVKRSWSRVLKLGVWVKMR